MNWQHDRAQAMIGAQEELAFIIDTMTGALPLDPFNGDWQCFSRYCAMQADSMKRCGFNHLADVAQAYANRAARKRGAA